MTESTTSKTQDDKAEPPTTYPEGNWKRKTSYGMGEYLKMDDETTIVSRGGKRIRMVKNVAFHVPIIPIGDLDEYGKDLLDAMLAGKRDPINDIVEFFKNYEPQPGMTFNKKAFKDAQQAEIDDEKEEEMKLMKEKMAAMMDRANEKDEKNCALNLEDPDFKKIPEMHPETKKHTFKEWFEILYSVCDPKDLTDNQCVDVMEVLMGGSYLTELKEMKAQEVPLNKIEKHFLKKDMTACIFDKNDPDFEKIISMHPDKKENTFKEHFDSLYSVCDPKGFTDDQCTDVMEIKMGGSYLDELKDLKKKDSDLDTIELHFLSKDTQENKQEKKKEPVRNTSKLKPLLYKKRAKREEKDDEKPVDLSYYRHITGIYKSYKPELTRTLRSSSVERQKTPDLASHSPSVFSYSTNSPPSRPGTPFHERVRSVPRDLPVPYKSCRGEQYSRPDSKVAEYKTCLGQLDSARRLVRQNRDQSATGYAATERFSQGYNYYDSHKFSGDYLYPFTQDVLGSWKHYNRRAASPVRTRQRALCHQLLRC